MIGFYAFSFYLLSTALSATILLSLKHKRQAFSEFSHRRIC
ncbi:hypothetical protein D931_00840 [Enterococcus faecium 13.SD.W.09]|nr:hypothetical protein D931_00840 [Enterococcus faecium 13.SD.W.09]